MAVMPPTREYSPSIEAQAPSAIEFDLLDLLLVMAERKLTILLATLIGLVLAMAIVLLIKPTYTSKVVIMPPQQGQSSAALVSQLGSLASLTGLGSSGALKDPNDLYLAILQSNAVADALIQRLGLQAVYHSRRLSEARFILAGNSKFVSDKGGMIAISVKDTDPRRAAQIANAYVDELHAINSRLVIGEASVRRLFSRSNWRLPKTG